MRRRSGDVVRHPLPSDHGLWAGLLTWADNNFLVIDYSVIRGGAGDDEMDQSSAASAPTLIWPVGDGEPHVLELEGAERSAEVTSTSGGWLLVTDHRDRRSRLGVFDVRGRATRQRRVRPGVVTERSLLLVRLIPDRLVTGYHFAPDLLDSPVVTAPAPGARLDPRVPVAGGLLVVGVLAALVIRRRLRVQP